MKNIRTKLGLSIYIVYGLCCTELSAQEKSLVIVSSRLDTTLVRIKPIRYNETDLKHQLGRLILPTGLIAYGIIAQNNNDLRDVDYEISEEVNEHMRIGTKIDNYLQFAPTTAVLALSLAGVKSVHSTRDQVVVLALSNLIMAGTINITKGATKVWRPDGSSQNSFPSGHTATGFVGAHVLFREYHDTSPLLAWSGYVASTATGVMRVLNKRHWASDAMAGAGVGIMSAELGYLLLPVVNKLLLPVVNKLLFPHSTNKKESLAITPIIGTQNVGVGIAYVF